MTNYEVYIAEEDTVAFELVADITDTTYLFTGEWGTRYFWKIKAESSLGFERWSAEEYSSFFVVAPELEPFHLILPENGAHLDSSEVQLIWGSTIVSPGDSGETNYQVYLMMEDTIDFAMIGETSDTTFIFTATTGNTYYWRIKALSDLGYQRWAEEMYWNFLILDDNAVASNTSSDEIPSEFGINAVYPNPFNASTMLTVALPKPGNLTVTVYNLTGRLVTTLASGSFAPGNHTFTFNASTLATGIYFIRAQVPGKPDELRKVILMK